jgi:hypothetical protein
MPNRIPLDTSFETRLLLQRTICLRGEDAAKVFYDQNRFYRKGAAPARMQKTLSLGGQLTRGPGHE